MSLKHPSGVPDNSKKRMMLPCRLEGKIIFFGRLPGGLNTDGLNTERDLFEMILNAWPTAFSMLEVIELSSASTS